MYIFFLLTLVPNSYNISIAFAFTLWDTRKYGLIITTKPSGCREHEEKTKQKTQQLLLFCWHTRFTRKVKAGERKTVRRNKRGNFFRRWSKGKSMHLPKMFWQREICTYVNYVVQLKQKGRERRFYFIFNETNATGNNEAMKQRTNQHKTAYFFMSFISIHT